MMASRKIEDLLPEHQDRFKAWLMACKEADIAVLITCTYRSQEEQDAVYLQGRAPVLQVNEARKKAGLGPIDETQNKRVTQVTKSKHTSRRALDFVIIKEGKTSWDLKVDVDKDGAPDYEEAGRIAQKCGLRWGGDWNGNGSTKDETFTDYPHIEVA